MPLAVQRDSLNHLTPDRPEMIMKMIRHFPNLAWRMAES